MGGDNSTDADETCNLWHDVPDEHLRQWRAAFSANVDGLNVSSPCPVCGHFDLHEWYLVGEPCDLQMRGVAFRAKGAGWQWCSYCRSYVHFSGFVPALWKSDLSVDMEKLSHNPEAIERRRKCTEAKHDSEEKT